MVHDSLAHSRSFHINIINGSNPIFLSQDMSFPSSTIILSNALPREHQGIAASLVSTVVNYSISLGLGFAGTVESSIKSHNPNVLHGYRSAWYMGIGLAGMGWVIAAAFVVTSMNRK